VNILGISYFDAAHDTSAAIVCDGELIAAAEEERFTRRKHESSIPLQAIQFCLKAAAITMSDVDMIACPELPYRTGVASNHGELEATFFKRLLSDHRIRFRSLLHKHLLDFVMSLRLVPFNCNMKLETASGLLQLRRQFECLPPVRFYDHHRAHAAASYHTSGYNRSAIVTLDESGGLCSTVTWEGRGNGLRRMDAMPYYNSLGLFYSDCTSYLGFKLMEEGKTMGLASYGNNLVYADKFRLLLNREISRWYNYQPKLGSEFLGFGPRKYEEFVVQHPYTDFAAGAQHALQEAVKRVAKAAISETQCEDLCLGGGVALNCTSNGALLASGTPTSMWVFPATGDAGLSIGAALLLASETGELQRKRIEHAYWGPEFGPTDCEFALRSAAKLIYWKPSDLSEEVARYLAAGKIVGWFQGRMELGPRALGNRSILADPRKRETRDRVNKLKGREPWRPLSPVVLAEHASNFFELRDQSPFMLLATKARPEKQATIPAVVHVDGSARPQTVTRTQNPQLYDLLIAFSQHTTVPVLLNTSFNAAGEPIVCTPQDAIKTFLATGLDVLVLGNYVARRKSEGNVASVQMG